MMRMQLRAGRLTDPKAIRLLFGLCWAAYFTTYLGRLNYTACLVEITAAEGWTKGEAGLIATGFFAAYGLGQLVNGFAGDRFSPRIMVALGLGASGLVNLAFPLLQDPMLATAVWCANGFVQSMVWSPLVRLFAEWLPAENRLRACVDLNSTVPLGTLAAYGMSAGLVFLGNWKLDFFFSGACLLVMTAVWLKGLGRLEQRLAPAPEPSAAHREKEPERRVSLWALCVASAMPLCCAALVVQGMLKDGVTTWIPTFMEEQFHLPAAAAILSTTVVPLINLSGVYLASWVDRHLCKNELRSSLLLFGAGAAALALLAVFSGHSTVLAMLLLALTTTFMMGVNTLLVSMLPSYYVRYGVCSSASGILNASAYVGCALSSYGSGAVAELWGWNSIILLWCAGAVAGAAVCALAAGRWARFRRKVTADQ